ncbi:MAG: hypothetical protein ABIW82_18040 [Dokdonella sp.]
MLIATAIWRVLFPHGFWFVELWVGAATGGLAGLLAGSVWQLSNSKRRPDTSGRFILTAFLALGSFSAVSVFLLGPDIRAQESERSKIRSLVASEIVSISVHVHGKSQYDVDGKQSISSFVGLAREAELFFPSHEGSSIQLTLTVHLKDGSAFGYKCRVPERHQNDLALGFVGYFAQDEILIPGGASWLSEVSG